MGKLFFAFARIFTLREKTKLTKLYKETGKGAPPSIRPDWRAIKRGLNYFFKALGKKKGETNHLRNIPTVRNKSVLVLKGNQKVLCATWKKCHIPRSAKHLSAMTSPRTSVESIIVRKCVSLFPVLAYLAFFVWEMHKRSNLLWSEWTKKTREGERERVE